MLNVKIPENVLPYTGIHFFARVEMGWDEDNRGGVPPTSPIMGKPHYLNPAHLFLFHKQTPLVVVIRSLAVRFALLFFVLGEIVFFDFSDRRGKTLV